MKIALLNWPVSVIKGDLYGGLETSLVDLKRGLALLGNQVSLYGRVAGSSTEFQNIQYLNMPYIGRYGFYREFNRCNKEADVFHFHNCPQGALYRPERSVAVFQNELHVEYHRIFPGRYNRATFVFVSEYLKNRVLAQHPGIRPSRCRVIHNAVDTELFKPAPPGPPDPVPVITFAGQWNKKKGFDVLLAAARILQNRGVKFVLNLAGGADLWPGQDGITGEEIKSFCDGLDCLRLLGKLSQADLAATLERSTIAVVPSVWAEPFGKAAIEAMACGLPVIATKTGGLPEIVVEGKTGLLVTPGDPVALAEAIQRLVMDQNLARAMGQAARADVLQRFSLDRWIQRFEDLHQEIMADG
jgi:glycosyltransferase involved in cell wall biosynthesis